MHLCWKKIFNFERFFVYIFETTENFFILIFSRERTSKKTIGNVYNILKNIIYSNEKITLNFVKNINHEFPGVFYV